jgi:site-specific recombinase XerD
LYSEGYTTENRLKNLRLPKAPVKMIEPLTKEEIHKITSTINMSSPTGVRNHAILILALDTGLRASEIVGIKLSGLNLEKGNIKVMGKGAKERIVPIGKFVQGILWHYIDEVRPKLAENPDELFLAKKGMPITVNTIKLMFSRLARDSGIRRLHAHLCRHTFAINYLLNGGDIFSLREILGHTTLEMVNHYLHFTSAQITEQHHKYSPMDRLQGELKNKQGY